MGPRFFLLAALLLSSSVAQATTKVVILDTGLDLRDSRFTAHLCLSGNKDFTGKGLSDHFGHGTHIAGLITRTVNPDYCLVIVKYTDQQSDPVPRFTEAFIYSLSLNPDIINISGGGDDYVGREYEAIEAHPSTLVVAAAGNGGSEKERFYPADYSLENVVAVGALSSSGSSRAPFSNFGSFVRFWEIGENVWSTLPNNKYGAMTGTSQATAIHTARILDEKSR